jgi:NAD-dependent deacetylase
MEQELKSAIEGVVNNQGRLVVLTGAGISAESGVPTFRGPEGFWTVGSRNFRPEEMATFAMFSQNPEVVWQWYLYRIGICRSADPNPGHLAVVKMEAVFGDRFLLITQNVDGLHLRAGNSLKRTYQIHGHIETLRCGRECSPTLSALPDIVKVKEKGEPISAEELDALKCPTCGALRRPHVLWFDECYNEKHFRFNSSIEAASAADLLLVVGTSGATNLPMQVGTIAASQGAVVVDVNPDFNPFSGIATQSGGYFCQGPAGEILPEFVEAMGA